MSTVRVDFAARLCAVALALCVPIARAPAQAPRFRFNPSSDLNEPGKKAAPEDAQRLATLAIGAMAKGELDRAAKEFRSILAILPGNVPTLINLGLVEYRRRHYSEAEILLKQATRAQPEHGLAWLVLGLVFHDQDKLDAALAALSQAVLYAPKDARAHHYLGVTIGKKGWYLGAEDEMRKAITLDPEYEEAHFNLAIFYLQRNPPAVELARRHYQKALDLGAPPDAEVEKRLSQPAP